MRLVLLDISAEIREQFYPLALSRPVFDLRCGMNSLADKLIAKTGARELACFVPDYLEDVFREQSGWAVNDLASLTRDDLFIVDGRVKANSLDMDVAGASQAVWGDQGELLVGRIAKSDAVQLPTDSISSFLNAIKEQVDSVDASVEIWNYTWDLVLSNPDILVDDFRSCGVQGVEGTVEEPNAIRGSQKDVFIGPGALVHPMVVIDAENGPVYIDEGAEIHPFSRIEGPCYIGRKSILLGAKCREGNSIGDLCRVGGEVEESIIHGYSNKYHDGFLGHAYVGEWVNLGAFTTNSDLKNDYTNVTMTLDGHTPIDTGSQKVGALIGDHTKTSIGTLMNTGANVGAMALIAASGKPLPKFIPSFAWFLEGAVTKGFGKRKLYETAQTVMDRRGRTWSSSMESMWDEIFRITASQRNELVKKGRKALSAQRG